MKIFVTGIGTGIGKTIVSAILAEALHADYWKPIQAGNLDFTDTDQVRNLITNSASQFHPETYRLKEPASPHHSASLEGIKMELKNFHLPKAKNHLVIEGAGGALAPINKNHLMADLIVRLKAPVVLVSKHYLGSINHTLLSIEALRKRKIKILGVIFNGNENKATEEAILHFGKIKYLGRVNEEAVINKRMIRSYVNSCGLPVVGSLPATRNPQSAKGRIRLGEPATNVSRQKR